MNTFLIFMTIVASYVVGIVVFSYCDVRFNLSARFNLSDTCEDMHIVHAALWPISTFMLVGMKGGEILFKALMFFCRLGSDKARTHHLTVKSKDAQRNRSGWSGVDL